MKRPDLLDYLPGVYHKWGGEYSPLKALLLISDQIFSEIERNIDRIDTYFDPRLTPTSTDKGRDFLSWLASWVVLSLDESWSEQKTRYLVRTAAQLYRHRGTPKGLKRMLKEFLDVEVEIREWAWPEGMEIGRRSRIGGDTLILTETDLNHCFMVIWKPPSRDVNQVFTRKIRKIRELIDLERPVHTQCYLHLEYPEEEPSEISSMIIGVSSVIGLCYIDREVADERKR